MSVPRAGARETCRAESFAFDAGDHLGLAHRVEGRDLHFRGRVVLVTGRGCRAACPFQARDQIDSDGSPRQPGEQVRSSIGLQQQSERVVVLVRHAHMAAVAELHHLDAAMAALPAFDHEAPAAVGGVGRCRKGHGDLGRVLFDGIAGAVSPVSSR